MRTRSVILILLLAELVTTGAMPIGAETVRVKWDSPGPVFDGKTWETAYHTVREGLKASVSGDQVWVASGVYRECSNVLKDGVALYGGFAGTEVSRDQRDWTANVTVLEGSDRCAYGVVKIAEGNSPTTRLDGFTIRNGHTTMYGGGGVYCYNSSPTIANNTITANSAGGVCCQQSSPTIVNNVVVGNAGAGCGGISCTGGTIKILNNVVTANVAICQSAGIQCEGDDVTISGNVVTGNSRGGIRCWYSRRAVITNNTVVSNSWWGIYCLGNTSVVAANNIVAFCGRGVGFVYSAVDVHNNCVYGNTDLQYYGLPQDPTGINGNICADPKLADVGYGNVHIQPDSPCVDAGSDESVVGQCDVKGRPRVLGSRVDMGAYESDGSIWPRVVPRIVHVSPDGDDSNDGLTWAAAKKTLQGGIDAVSPSGGEVWVKAGSYDGEIWLKPYSYMYGGFDGTESQRSQRCPRTNTSVINGRINVESGHGVSTIEGFETRDISCVLADTRIANNVITGLKAGITCDSTSPEIVNNVITGAVHQYGYPSCIECQWSCARVVNNTIVGNPGCAGITSFASRLQIANNVIVGNSIGVDVMHYPPEPWLGTPVLENNCICGNTAYDYRGIEPGSEDLSADPMFRNLALGDYRLLPDSPCIDAGTNEGAPELDIYGNSRPVDGNLDGSAVADIGAYEYQPVRAMIDVLPGNATNVIRLTRNRQIPVGVLSTAEFDATRIAPLSVVFGPGKATEVHGRGHWEDVNGDGLTDLLFHFSASASGLIPGDTSVMISGRLADGERIWGTDSVTIVGR